MYTFHMPAICWSRLGGFPQYSRKANGSLPPYEVIHPCRKQQWNLYCLTKGLLIKVKNIWNKMIRQARWMYIIYLSYWPIAARQHDHSLHNKHWHSHLLQTSHYWQCCKCHLAVVTPLHRLINSLLVPGLQAQQMCSIIILSVVFINHNGSTTTITD